MKYLYVLLLTGLIAPLAYAAELAVPSQYTTIEDALNAASDDDVIILAPGTYTSAGNTGLTISNLAVTIRSQDPDDSSVVAQTIINCQGSNENRVRAFHISNNTGTVNIQGITIGNGYSTAGGAILLTSSSLSLYRCIIDGCTSISDGGAIAITEGSTFIDDSSVYTDNTSVIDGGAISANGSSAITLRGSALSRNTSGRDGGALLFNDNSSAVVIDSCSITGNNSTDFGGGVNFTSCKQTTIKNSLIAGNYSESHGGGIYYNETTYVTEDTATNLIVNCTITENRCGSLAQGGGLRLLNSELKVANTVIWDNLAYIDPQDSNNNGQYPEVAIAGENSLLQIAFCLIQGALDTDFDNEYVFLELGSLVERLGGNISGPPSFTAAGSWSDDQWSTGNYLPVGGSFCFNGGSTDYIDDQWTEDIAQETRIKGLTVDIGAYEMDIPDGPDLTATMEVDLKYSGELIPGDKAKATVTVTNSGNEDVEGEIGVSLYFSSDQYLDGSDTLIYSSDKKTKVKFQIDKLKPKAIKISFVVPGDVNAGDFYMLAHIDDDNSITEADESMISNVIVSDQYTLAWKFGNFGSRKNAKLIMEDAQGIETQYMVKDGWAELNQNRSDIDIVSSSEKCTLTVKPRSKNGIPELGDITCNGPLSINAKTHNLAGNIYITGTLPKLALNDVKDSDSGYTITILGTSTDGKTGSTIQFNNATNLSLDSPDYPVKAIKVNSWDNTTGAPILIQTPWIKSLSSKEDFDASLIVSGANAPKDISIGSAKVSGNIEGATWRVEGDIKNIQANRLIDFILFHGTADGVTDPTGELADIDNQYTLSMKLSDSSIAMQDTTIITWEVGKFSFSSNARAEGNCYFEYFSSKKTVPLPEGTINPAESASQTLLMLENISAIWQPWLKQPFNMF